MTYQGGIGTDEPVYVWFEYGKSAADYALTEERFWKSLGDAGAALSEADPGPDPQNGNEDRALPARSLLRPPL
ncbi:MAG: hypothetical protein MZV70_18355 [Desulfobacterales bacterium]|nr:hypothetical protein [Desulfobacterales bacterium]